MPSKTFEDAQYTPEDVFEVVSHIPDEMAMAMITAISTPMNDPIMEKGVVNPVPVEQQMPAQPAVTPVQPVDTGVSNERQKSKITPVVVIVFVIVFLVFAGATKKRR